MASRINDNIRAEWDSIDLENHEPKDHEAHSRTTKAASDPNEGSKVKGNARNLTLSSLKTRKSPIRKHQPKHSGLTLEQSDQTQDCITLEPGPAIQSPYTWLYPRQSFVFTGKQSVTNGTPRTVRASDKKGSQTGLPAVTDINETSDQNLGSDEDEDSIDESDQEPTSNGQNSASSTDETEESPTDGDESKLGSPITGAPEGIRLPIDSDDEEFKAVKERRIRAYAKNGSWSEMRSPLHDEKRRKQPSISGLHGNPINLVSSTAPSTPTDHGQSQQSSMLPPLQAKQSSHNQDKKAPSSIKGNQIPIPVSSSTDASQNSRSSKPEDVQVQRTPLQFKVGNSKTSDKNLNSVSYPSLPSMTSAAVGSVSRSSLEQNHSKPAPSNLPQPAFTSTTSMSVSPRKHSRPSLGSSREPSSSPRKRQRIDNPIAILPRPQGTSEAIPASMTSTPRLDSRLDRITNPTPQHLHPQGSSKLMPSTPGIEGTKLPTPNQHPQSIHPTPTRPTYYGHTLPQISASQPVPERPRIRQAAQATISGLSPQTRMFPAEVARQAVTANEKVSEPPKPFGFSPIELDLEPLTIILDLRGIDYCMAVQNSRVYSGLQSLFCEFLATYLTYLGNMDHLFSLCIWLLRSAMDPHQQERIDEEFWDDFILQHQQGKYNAYVQHCLAKVRQPGSWVAWYGQAQKHKPVGNVVTTRRLQNILLGREIATSKRKIPLLLSRFVGAS
ncbi:MAG: hypothetical protein GOMPHAMPRED_005313 [Gomphillus americanus]|uniref:Uncharacterized protein n=1 Tax=Gomphillus americanus TaxID=1940652 RepID=A0A8H3IIC0_9LECA|nr:MAG: hypothetical protein GOMPHAMPRED_005313 [Gomphillus americanus]